MFEGVSLNSCNPCPRVRGEPEARPAHRGSFWNKHVQASRAAGGCLVLGRMATSWMAASITHDIHSASFCETFCIEQMGKKDIAIAKSVSDAIESNFCDNLAGAAKLAEQWEHGELIDEQAQAKLKHLRNRRTSSNNDSREAQAPHRKLCCCEEVPAGAV